MKNGKGKYNLRSIRCYMATKYIIDKEMYKFMDKGECPPNPLQHESKSRITKEIYADRSKITQKALVKRALKKFGEAEVIKVFNNKNYSCAPYKKLFEGATTSRNPKDEKNIEFLETTKGNASAAG